MILEYPNDILRAVSKPVVEFGDSLKSLIDTMAEEMYATGGVGIAAPQIGESVAVALVDVSQGEDSIQMKILINPTIEPLGKRIVSREGCLSVPGRLFDVDRNDRIKVKFQNVDGSWSEEIFEEFEACVVQHECDHLNGITLVERTDKRKRTKYLRDMKNFRKFSRELENESQ